MVLQVRDFIREGKRFIDRPVFHCWLSREKQAIIFFVFCAYAVNQSDEMNERNNHSGITSLCCISFSHAELKDDGGDVNWFPFVFGRNN